MLYPALGSFPVKQMSEGIAFGCVDQVLNALFFRADVQNHAYGFDWFPALVKLGGGAQPVPNILSVCIRNAQLCLPIGCAGGDTVHQAQKGRNILRMNMG